MPNAADRDAVIRENLTDAGLSAERIACCMKLLAQNSNDALVQYLACYRKELLDRIHTDTARLDCLDYLTYTLRKR